MNISIGTYKTVVNLIGNTTTRAGFVVRATVDQRDEPQVRRGGSYWATCSRSPARPL